MNYFDWLKRIFYPFFFVVTFLVFLGFSLFKGQAHRSLIAEVEERWIDASLFVLGPRAQDRQSEKFFLALGDLDVEKKLESLVRIYEKKPAFVFLFQLENFLEEEKSLSFLKNILEKAGDQTRTILALDPKKKWNLPEALQGLGLLLFENDPCEMNHQRICPYNPRWKKWLGVFLLETFSKNLDFSNFSEDLYRDFPSFLIYFNETEEVFFLNEDKGKAFLKNNLLEKKIVFVDFFFSEKKDKKEEEIKHLFSRENYSLSLFWFDFLQFSLDGDVIQTISPFWKKTIFSLVSFFIIGAILAFDSFGLFFFVLILLSSFLFFNSMGVLFFRLYMPLATLSFFVLSFALLGGFLKLSYVSYRREVDLLYEKEMLDLKRFRKIVISIISHNLNTPLAQIQGLLDLVQSESSEDSFVLGDLRELKSSLGFAYLNVKLFLTVISIQSGRLSEMTLNLKEFLVFLKKESKLCLENIGLKLKVHHDPTLLSHPVHGSAPVVSYVIFCFSYFFREKAGSKNLDLLISCEEKSEHRYILFELLSTTAINPRYFSKEAQALKKENFKNSLERVILKFFGVIEKFVSLDYFYREKEEGKFSLYVRMSFRSFS